MLCRLILIAEKDTVYDKFPTPLINRLEKHFVLTSSILKDWQEDVLEDFDDWIKKFSDAGYMHPRTFFCINSLEFLIVIQNSSGVMLLLGSRKTHLPLLSSKPPTSSDLPLQLFGLELMLLEGNGKMCCSGVNWRKILGALRRMCTLISGIKL